MLITLTEFAEMHNVSIQAIRWQVSKNKIKTTTKYGKVLINDKTKYSPIRGRGRK
jgi:hypothetical protein